MVLNSYLSIVGIVLLAVLTSLTLISIIVRTVNIEKIVTTYGYSIIIALWCSVPILLLLDWYLGAVK